MSNHDSCTSNHHHHQQQQQWVVRFFLLIGVRDDEGSGPQTQPTYGMQQTNKQTNRFMAAQKGAIGRDDQAHGSSGSRRGRRRSTEFRKAEVQMIRFRFR